MVKQGKSSDILFELYGDYKKYQNILRPHIQYILKKYPNQNLNSKIKDLDKKIITIAPMVFCDSLIKDMGYKVDNRDLAALGLLMLLISTHDDVVDEMPGDQVEVAALTYSGNIVSNEGLKILIKQNKSKAAELLLSLINQNHLYQQHVIETLWQKKPANFKEYRDGINHICVFVSIGLLYGLALADKMKYKNKIIKYSEGYGVSLQLIDDLREVEEDRPRGYWSYPMLDEEPFSDTFLKINQHIKMAQDSISPDWTNLKILMDNLERFIDRIQN